MLRGKPVTGIIRITRTLIGFDVDIPPVLKAGLRQKELDRIVSKYTDLLMRDPGRHGLEVVVREEAPARRKKERFARAEETFESGFSGIF